MTGQTLPVLFAVTLHNIDAYLTGTMVLLGACTGIILNVYKCTRPFKHEWVDWALQMWHTTQTSIISLSFCRILFDFLHPSGAMVATIPAFWIVMQPLALKPTSILVFFLISLALFYFSLIISPEMIFDSYYTQAHQRQLQAMSERDWYKKRHVEKTLVIKPELHEVHSSFPAAFYIFVLSAYACSCQEPLYNFANKYCSPSLLFHRGYSVFVCTLSALFKAYLITTIAWMQYNVIHLLLEKSPTIFWPIRLYVIALLFSVAWHVNHAYNNLFANKSLNLKIKYVIFLFAIAYMYKWTAIQTMCLTFSIFFLVTTTVFVCFF